MVYTHINKKVKMPAKQESNLQKSAGIFRVLIVFEDAIDVYVIQSALMRKGVKSDNAKSAREAESLVEQRIRQTQEGAQPAIQMYDIVLFDYSMPGMESLQFVRKLLSLVSKAKILIPPAICSYSEPADAASLMQNAMACGMMDYFMTKPIDPEGLDKVLIQLNK